MFEQLPDIDEVLNCKETPSFLQKKRDFESIFQSNQKNNNQTESIIKPKTQPVIEKSAQIDKNSYYSIKETQKNYENFVDLIQLTQFTKKVEQENAEKSVPATEENIPKQNSSAPPKSNNQHFKNKNNPKTGVSKKPIGKDKEKKSYKGGGGNKSSIIKEKEKLKRKKGQSTHGSWKPETYMKLRQQFD